MRAPACDHIREVRRLLPSLILLAGPALAASHWIEYRSGPLHVISDAGDKPARDRLAEMEQLRYVLGDLLGKGGPVATANSGLDAVWPIEVVLFSKAREYAPHAPPQPLIDGGSATLGAWTADTPLPHDLLRALARLLIDDNAGRMPPAIETALCDLFSTIQVDGTHVMLGAPPSPGELPPDRMRAWAKMQMLVTNPDYGGADYGGKVQVYLNNFQQGGDESVGARNAFDTTPAKLDARVDAYLRAGSFEAVQVSAEALSPAHDFIEKPTNKEAVDALLDELAAGGKNFPPRSPRGLLATGTRPALEQAAKANPRWGEPHFLLAKLETDASSKIAELKTAATLEPRNAGYWQALAEAQADAHQYGDAAKSWAFAEKAAPTEAERERIHRARIDMDERQAAFEAAEKKRIAEEQARDLQRVKDSAAAEVHAAEAAANKKLGEFKSDKPVEPWWENPQGDKVAGKLARVDCLTSPNTGGPLRLTIQIDGGGAIRLLIRDPNQLVVQGGGEAKFVCGIQRPPRKIRAVYNVKADAKLGTVGDVAMVEFP